MKYLEFINQKIKEIVSKPDNLVLFGQNISAGSCLGGLTRGLKLKNNELVINSTNAENSLCGFGFGLMINGISSIFFVKQLDFLILGLDHLVNTYNIIRNSQQKNDSSFTIMPIVSDNGYEGPQASFNNLSDMCSMARIPGFSITTKWEIEKILETQLVSTGFRIITVSQRLFKKELLSPEKVFFVNNENTLFQYSKGNDATIVCFNFSFPQGYELFQELKKNNINSTIFNVTSSTPIDWQKIIEDVLNTETLIVLDDSKSVNLSCDSLLSDTRLTSIKNRIILKKPILNDWLNPNQDLMEIDIPNIIDQLKNLK